MGIYKLACKPCLGAGVLLFVSLGFAQSNVLLSLSSNVVTQKVFAVDSIFNYFNVPVKDF